MSYRKEAKKKLLWKFIFDWLIQGRENLQNENLYQNSHE